MDAEPSPPAKNGGTVEPANRAAVAKERFQTPIDLVGDRYELRDPFAEVTYRTRTSQEMAGKAEQLGATRPRRRRKTTAIHHAPSRRPPTPEHPKLTWPGSTPRPSGAFALNACSWH